MDVLYHGSRLDPLLFIVYVSDLPEEMYLWWQHCPYAPIRWFLQDNCWTVPYQNWTIFWNSSSSTKTLIVWFHLINKEVKYAHHAMFRNHTLDYNPFRKYLVNISYLFIFNFINLYKLYYGKNQFTIKYYLKLNKIIT